MKSKSSSSFVKKGDKLENQIIKIKNKGKEVIFASGTIKVSDIVTSLTQSKIKKPSVINNVSRPKRTKRTDLIGNEEFKFASKPVSSVRIKPTISLPKTPEKKIIQSDTSFLNLIPKLKDDVKFKKKEKLYISHQFDDSDIKSFVSLPETSSRKKTKKNLTKQKVIEIPNLNLALSIDSRKKKLKLKSIGKHQKELSNYEESDFMKKLKRKLESNEIIKDTINKNMFFIPNFTPTNFIQNLEDQNNSFKIQYNTENPNSRPLSVSKYASSKKRIIVESPMTPISSKLDKIQDLSESLMDSHRKFLFSVEHKGKDNNNSLGNNNNGIDLITEKFNLLSEDTNKVFSKSKVVLKIKK